MRVCRAFQFSEGVWSIPIWCASGAFQFGEGVTFPFGDSVAFPVGEGVGLQLGEGVGNSDLVRVRGTPIWRMQFGRVCGAFQFGAGLERSMLHTLGLIKSAMLHTLGLINLECHTPSLGNAPHPQQIGKSHRCVKEDQQYCAPSTIRRKNISVHTLVFLQILA